MDVARLTKTVGGRDGVGAAEEEQQHDSGADSPHEGVA
jgi:hypothetical protein